MAWTLTSVLGSGDTDLEQLAGRPGPMSMVRSSRTKTRSDVGGVQHVVVRIPCRRALVRMSGSTDQVT